MENVIIYITVILSGFFVLFLFASSQALKIVSERLKQNYKRPNHYMVPEATNDTLDLCIFDINKKDDYRFNKIFADQYFEKLKKYTSIATESVMVLDYLSHNKHNKIKLNKGKKVIHLSEEYDDYYYLLEQVVKDQDIIYTRILQLPIDPQKSTFKDNYEKLNTKVLDLIFPQTFQHIKRMRSYPNFKLYIINPPIRLYSIMNIDNKYLLSEYDRYNKEGEAQPDILFIDKIGKEGQNEKIKRLISTYETQIHSVLEKKKPIDIDKLVKQADKEYTKLKKTDKLSDKKKSRMDRLENLLKA